jgi:1,4-dihydroxy-2-naphthoyl-CoA hydrolase
VAKRVSRFPSSTALSAYAVIVHYAGITVGGSKAEDMTAAIKLCVMSAELDALVALMPFAGHLGLVLDEASPDRVIARLDWAPHLCTSGGIMHGGVLMSLADTAGALVTFLGLPEGATTATITSTSQLFRPVSSGSVRAVAVTLHRGRATVTAQTSVYDSAKRLVVQTTQIQAVRQPPAPA